MPGALAQLVAFGKADAEWDRLFSNETLGYECPPEKKRWLADGIPPMKVLNNVNVQRYVAEARLPRPELVAYLGTLSTDLRIKWITSLKDICLAFQEP